MVCTFNDDDFGIGYAVIEPGRLLHGIGIQVAGDYDNGYRDFIKAGTQLFQAFRNDFFLLGIGLDHRRTQSEFQTGVIVAVRHL
jgi:hypothetical protein